MRIAIEISVTARMNISKYLDSSPHTKRSYTLILVAVILLSCSKSGEADCGKDRKLKNWHVEILRYEIKLRM
jgi:hypothetical protein